MQIRCSKCHGTGMYASRLSPICFECRGAGTVEGQVAREPFAMGTVAVVLAVTPDGSWMARTLQDVPRDDAHWKWFIAKMNGELACFASFAHGIGATRAEALATLGADLRRRGLSGVLRVVTERAVDGPHRDPLVVAVEADRKREVA